MIAFAVLAPLLAGCNAGGFSARADLSALRPGASTIAIVDTIAPNADIGRRFSEALSREATARGFTVVPANSAQSATQVKAYLDAHSVDATRTAYAYVLHTSPDGRTRGERATGAATVNLPVANAWSSMDDTTMRQLAAQSLDDLTRVLGGASDSSEPAPQE
jgi:cobalamin biosynthesis Mg chelatase CobN